MIVSVEKIVYGGYALARHKGKVIFIKNVLPEEKVKIKIVKEKKDHAFAEVVDIIESSVHRQDPECQHFGLCGGCDFQYVSYEYEMFLKKEMLEELLKREKIDVEIKEVVVSKSHKGYRNKSELPVKGGKRVRIGFFESKSHRVVNIKECTVHPRFFNEIIEVLRGKIERTKVSIYDENTGRGDLRYIILRTNPAKDVLIGFVSKSGSLSHEAWKGVEKRFKNIKGILVNYNPFSGSKITGDRIKNVYGRDFLKYRINGKTFIVSFLSFFQTNSYQLENMVGLIKDLLSPEKNDRIGDLYSGVGLFGISLAEDVKHVVLIEQASSSVEDARKNIEINQLVNIEVVKGDASWIREFEGINKLIVDPPRKGMSDEVIKAILHLSPERIAYVSCNPATFARDIKKLEEKYRLQYVVLIDMFPRTYHMEVVGLLLKND